MVGCAGLASKHRAGFAYQRLPLEWWASWMLLARPFDMLIQGSVMPPESLLGPLGRAQAYRSVMAEGGSWRGARAALGTGGEQGTAPFV